MENILAHKPPNSDFFCNCPASKFQILVNWHPCRGVASQAHAPVLSIYSGTPYPGIMLLLGPFTPELQVNFQSASLRFFNGEAFGCPERIEANNQSQILHVILKGA